MLRSKEIDAKRYPSFGRCIFCGSGENLTDEHIVPEALSGVGQLVIERGSCRSCNGYANENYEQPALNNEFAPVRHMLELRRKRRGAKQKPRRLPPVSFDVNATEDVRPVFDQELPVDQHPPVYQCIKVGPAGHLVGIDRSSGPDSIRFGFLHLGLQPKMPAPMVTRLKFRLGTTERVVAKMAYCYAIAEKGLDFFDASDLVDLLMGRRDDVFNFVGSPVVEENFAKRSLHRFYFRKRGEINTVIVHLFASFGGPQHEVVIGTDR